MNDGLHTEKKQMREAILALRDAMPAASRSAASRLIIEKICGLPAYQHARTVLAYSGFGSEIDTSALIERIIADGKIAVLPRVDRAAQSLILHSVKSLAELVPSKWGIREPFAEAPVICASGIEFILMPGVAFDRIGNRLGYGRGYYDRLLLGADPALARVAAAFSCQIVARVPIAPHDQKIDTVITENESINIHHER
ncbi:MAG: 5-formyltetrahydrofolate cyclo-ligase [Burkholderiales bacterium]|nr:5-formyltetrahydrofolate cyclo-ligase [Burkholderiales bacterium]